MAVIDDGICYWNNDFGGIFGTSKKVSGGWNYTYNQKDINYGGGWHGTQCAGVIGALTNNDSIGIAGIGGGWNPDSLGLQIIGYMVVDGGKY
ncbi:MAG: Peptidase protein [Ignavibacteria bacterium]|nr:Peptidase protein [Ignavibacteria bacterium]